MKIEIEQVTGISEFAETTISVFPIPVLGELNIESSFAAAIRASDIEIINPVGRILKRIEIKWQFDGHKLLMLQVFQQLFIL